MIARLSGVLVERLPTRIVVECGGVGYDVVCSQYTLAALPSEGEPVTLRIYTHVTDAKMSLFGFADAQERALFDLLITVKNVGPSTAIAILSGSNPRDIATLIMHEDLVGLTRIKGVGKKTAELTIVELHDKCAELVLGWDAGGALRPSANGSVVAPARLRGGRHPMIEEVMNALVGMGWRPQEAEQAVAELPVAPEATIEALLRQALRSMPR